MTFAAKVVAYEKKTADLLGRETKLDVLACNQVAPYSKVRATEAVIEVQVGEDQRYRAAANDGDLGGCESEFRHRDPDALAHLAERPIRAIASDSAKTHAKSGAQQR